MQEALKQPSGPLPWSTLSSSCFASQPPPPGSLCDPLHLGSAEAALACVSWLTQVRYLPQPWFPLESLLTHQPWVLLSNPFIPTRSLSLSLTTTCSLTWTISSPGRICNRKLEGTWYGKWGSEGVPSWACSWLGWQMKGSRWGGGGAEKGVGHSPGCPLGTRSVGSCQWCGFPGPGKAEVTVTVGVGTAGQDPSWATKFSGGQNWREHVSYGYNVSPETIPAVAPQDWGRC